LETKTGEQLVDQLVDLKKIFQTVKNHAKTNLKKDRVVYEIFLWPVKLKKTTNIIEIKTSSIATT